MNGRECNGAIYAGERPERLPTQEIDAWGETLVRWHDEGLGVDEDLNEVIGLVEEDRLFLLFDQNMAPRPIRVIEIGERYATLVDEYGVTKRLLRSDFDRTNGLMSGAAMTESMA